MRGEARENDAALMGDLNEPSATPIHVPFRIESASALPLSGGRAHWLKNHCFSGCQWAMTCEMERDAGLEVWVGDGGDTTLVERPERERESPHSSIVAKTESVGSVSAVLSSRRKVNEEDRKVLEVLLARR